MVGKFLGFLTKEEPAVDPVCHMNVDKKNPAGGSHEHDGVTYYFCGPGCRVKFSKEPEPYLSGEKGGHM
jgi:Cu+-exporting ATPase